jgi:hypothetical protein
VDILEYTPPLPEGVLAVLIEGRNMKKRGRVQGEKCERKRRKNNR